MPPDRLPRVMSHTADVPPVARTGVKHGLSAATLLLSLGAALAWAAASPPSPASPPVPPPGDQAPAATDPAPAKDEPEAEPAAGAPGPEEGAEPNAPAEGGETDPATGEPVAPPVPAARPELPSVDVFDSREPKPGDEVIVVYNDGRRQEGLLTRIDELGVVLRVAGIEFRVKKSDYERVFVLDSPEERYRQMRAVIGDDDTERLALLVDWLIREGLYDLAESEARHIINVDPTNGDAIRLQAQIKSMRALGGERRDPLKDPLKAPITEPVESSAARRPTPSEFALLTPEQINLMRVYELDLSDMPRVVVPRQTIEKLITTYADSPLIPPTRQGREAFMREDPARIIDVMFRLRARELYSQIEVLGNPRSFELFRDQIHATWLVNHMATTRCHGGSNAGALLLTNRRPTADASVYTNFLILERFETSEGRRMINYNEPEKSVLLQMALPTEDSIYPHPEVPGWTPAIRTRESRRFQQAVEWIRAMYRPRPEYPIEYTPPSAATLKGESETPAAADPEEEMIER